MVCRGICGPNKYFESKFMQLFGPLYITHTLSLWFAAFESLLLNQQQFCIVYIRTKVRMLLYSITEPGDLAVAFRRSGVVRLISPERLTRFDYTGMPEIMLWYGSWGSFYFMGSICRI